MDKRLEENKRVKNAIARAFFSLLRQKHADNIPVTEITATAKVSRMAYYRNFQTKMDVIDFYLQETVWNELNHMLGNDPQFHTRDYGVAFFRIMQKYSSLFLLLDDCGYASTVLKAFDQANANLIGDMPSNSIERYKIPCFAGASYNCMITWLRGGCRESAEELADYLFAFFGELA